MRSDLYLERIGISQASPPTAEFLARLHLAHLYTVPFENLDIVLDRPLETNLPSIYAKIVLRRRGGFCYELNGLFAWLLRELGYRVTLLAASDLHDDGTLGPELDHLTLLVECPADPSYAPAWLADVGWGDSYRLPLRLDAPGEQEQFGRAYWFEDSPEDAARTLMQRDAEGKVEGQYRFTPRPRAFAEFAPMFFYHSTAPESVFSHSRICSLATPTGRVSLRDDRLIITENGERTIRDVNEEELPALLSDHFGILLE